MTAPVATDADQTEVSSLLTNLANLEMNRVVDENAADLAEYGLAEPKIAVAFKATAARRAASVRREDADAGRHLRGEARRQERVFLVSAFLESTLRPQAVRPARQAGRSASSATRPTASRVTTPAGKTVMTRAGSDWRITAPAATRADYGAIEGLLTRVSTAMMSGIVETAPKDLKKYGLDTPQTTLVHQDR